MTAVHEVWAVVWDATWGNNMASVEVGAVLSVVGYLGRHHLGRKVGQWLAGHISEHMK